MKETVDIHGKKYETVASRVSRLLTEKEGYKITTEIVSFDDNKAVVKAYILNDKNEVIATGHAFEKASSTFINKTSYLENAETSAVGRALAFCGFGGSEIASADEVLNAIENQKPDLRVDELTKLSENIKDLMTPEQADFLLKIQQHNYKLTDEVYRKLRDAFIKMRSEI